MGFLISTLVGALAGLIAGILFEQPLIRARDKLRAYLFRVVRSDRNPPSPVAYHFSFGRLDTSEVIVDGDGESAYSPTAIVCHYDPSPVPLPADLQKLRDNVERREKARAQAGEDYMWNGRMYALRRYARGRSDDDESLALHLWFGPSEWFTYAALNLELNMSVEHDGQMATLRDKYLGHVDWASPSLQPDPYFSNTFGMNACLITADEQILLLRRSLQVSSNKGAYHIAINEGLQRPFDRSDTFDGPDLYRTVIRGAAEELGVELTREEITLLTFNADHLVSTWGVHGFARTKSRSSEVTDHRRMGAKDKWEGMDLVWVPFQLRRVVGFVFANTPWCPNALSCLYHTLVFHFGRKAVDAAIKAM